MVYRQGLVVALKSSGKILREKGDSVFLPFGSNYSILLKNESFSKALVNIEIDGECVFTAGKLILPGNTSQEVKGFMRNMSETNKFKFIEKTMQISSYRGDKLEDGLIKVTYQFEVEAAPITYSEPSWPSSYYKSSWPSMPASCITDPDVLYRSSKSLVANCSYSDCGITTKGKKIAVNYGYGSIGTLEPTKHIIILNLKGLAPTGDSVSAPLLVKSKLRCSVCGRNYKSSNTYCSNCGTCLR